jgi:KDO2-lipid IV(A) lauroyltransferase
MKLIMLHVVGYRKDVVTGNLKRSFPEKSEEEIKVIRSRFYLHLCDLMMESIKSFSISRKEALRRVKNLNPELLDEYYDKGQDIILVSGHYGNWELYATAGAAQMKHKLVGIYKRLSNEFFDNKVQRSRGRFGCELVSSKEVNDAFTAYLEPIAVAFLMDQAPVSSTRAWWMDFLNQDTAVLFGTERYAKKYNTPVIYGSIRKVRRGYYETHFELVTDQPQSHEKGEITEKMTRLLERDIRQQPEYWLWTHKRWKRRRDDGT